MQTKNKAFRDRRSRKLQKKRRIKKQVRSYSYDKKSVSHSKYDNEDYISSYDYSIDFPEIFSFKYNLDETVDFCASTLKSLNRYMYKSTILMNLNNVEEVSADAIMYLIAIIRNYKTAKIRLFSFCGNYPNNAIARNVFVESGFLSFVNSNSKKLPSNSKKQTIVSGRKSDSRTAGIFCDFVCQKLNMPKSYTNKLFEIIIEMMSNVVYHAYKNDDEMIPEWYIYAEYIENEIRFLFLDTGLGIAKTVQKHSLYEKVINKFGILSESELIKSAFEGEFRTQTGEYNHGKGMPYIKEFAFRNQVKDFHVISGKGHCWINYDEPYIYCKDIPTKLNGTIYSFSFVKTYEEISICR